MSVEVPDDAKHLFWFSEGTNNFSDFKLSRIPTEVILSTAKYSFKEIGMSVNDNFLERVKFLKRKDCPMN